MELPLCHCRGPSHDGGQTHECRNPKFIYPLWQPTRAECLRCHDNLRCVEPRPFPATATPPAAAPATGDCRHLGGDTGVEVGCTGCRGGGVRLKVLACAVHGTCTPGRAVEGHHCCVGCEQREVIPKALPPDEARPAVNLSRRHLLYHVYPVTGSCWPQRVAELRARIDLFTGRRIVAVAVDDTTDTTAAVRDSFRGEATEVFEVPNDPGRPGDPGHREVVSFLPLFERLEGETGAVLWAHAKGVTRGEEQPQVHSGVEVLWPLTSAVRWWTEMMQDGMLDYWPLVEQQLQRYACAGCFKMRGPFWFSPQFPRAGWLYSGSWCWYRAADLFAGDWRTIDPFWAGIESYPGGRWRWDEAGSLFGEGWGTLYNPAHVRTVVLPAWRAWQERHTAWRTVLAPAVN